MDFCSAKLYFADFRKAENIESAKFDENFLTAILTDEEYVLLNPREYNLRK